MVPTSISLQPARDYVWAVEAIGSEASGEASFRTLDARTSRARRLIALHGDDPDALIYLEALDAILGLSKGR